MGFDKLSFDLGGETVLERSVRAFDECPEVDELVIVTGASSENAQRAAARCKKPVRLVKGGSTRAESARSGVAAAHGRLVAVHDAARPLVEVPMIEGAVAAVRQDGRLAGAICAARSIDTLKLVEGTDIVATPDRTFYWAAQTPQVFRTREVVAAYKAALWDGYQGTDDSSLVERHGGRVRCVECSRDNIKVTIPEDLAVAEATLEQRLVEEGCGRRPGRDVQ